MKIIETTFERLPRERLVIGFEGENLRATVRIDCASVFAEYPNATPALIVKPLFADAYPVVVDRNGTDVDWLITSEILSFSGDGEIQLVFYKDQVICKSAVSKIRVSRSLTVTGDMPDPVVQWIENANRKLAEVDAQIVELEGMVDTATDAATRAEQSASDATAAAQSANESEQTAIAKATEATTAAGTATAKAAEAALSATQARNSAVSAADSESGAIQKAAEAAQSAQTANTKAGQATEAAQTATGKAGEASASATAAQTSASNAAASATAASASETAARASETAAGASATQAAQSAQTANTAAQTATQKAAEATQSATDAETFAGTATTKAEEAAESAQAASDAKAAVEKTAEQLAESLEQIAQNTHDIADHEQYAEATYAKKTDLYKKADIIHNTASGSIASFPDGAEMPVDEVTAQINPVQDLHGYDHPWPAGGGENKINLGNSYTFTTTKDQPIDTIPQGTAWVYRDSFSYTTTPASGAKNPYVVFYDENNNAVGGVWVNPNGKTSSVSLTGDAVKVRIYSNGYNYSDSNGVEVTITGLVISTTEVSAYTPYSNICPISGFDSVKVWDDPKYGGTIKWNQLAENGTNASTHYAEDWASTIEKQDGVFTVTTTRDFEAMGMNFVTTDILFVKNHKYYVAVNSESAPSGSYLILFNFGSNWTNLASVSIAYTGAKKYSAIMTASDDGVSGQPQRLMLRVNASSGNTIPSGSKWVFSKVLWVDLTEMFGSGNEPTIEQFEALFQKDFYPYNAGETTTVSAVNGDPYRQVEVEFPSEAGTVYGGSLTIADDGSGVLTVDRAEVDLGTLTWRKIDTASGHWRFWTVLNAMLLGGNMLSSQYKQVGASEQYMGKQGIANQQSGNNTLAMVSDERFADVSDFKTAMNGVQLVYKLATPITYTLTAPEITTLLGQNNFWHDANGDISVGYKANTKLYIDNKIAELVAQIVNS